MTAIMMVIFGLVVETAAVVKVAKFLHGEMTWFWVVAFGAIWVPFTIGVTLGLTVLTGAMFETVMIRLGLQ